jgi:hypothetical protein|nr:MAG TPA: hypothetical protein [Bacteriophage sp.]
MAVLWLKTLHRGGKELNIGFEGICLACVGFLLMDLYVCGGGGVATAEMPFFLSDNVK